MSDHPFDIWLITKEKRVGRHHLILLTESDGKRSEIMNGLCDLVRSHYIDPGLMANRMASLGAYKTAQLLRERLPGTKKSRSGDIGEIMATEVAEQKLRYQVPIRRLRWKDGREMALRGDDLIGVDHDRQKLKLLKGEAKSRAALSTSVLDQAATALDGDRGLPNSHSVLFVAERLREQGNDLLAEELEEAVLGGFRGVSVEHLLFVLSGSNPEALLSAHLAGATKKQRMLTRHVVGVWIRNHGQFIDLLFGEL